MLTANHLLCNRSSITNRLSAVADIGGVNSIRSFTRSWQRAAGFSEVIPQRPSFVFAPDQAPIAPSTGAAPIQYGRSDLEAGEATPRSSLLRQHFESAASAGSAPSQDEAAEPSSTTTTGQQRHSTDYREREAKALENELAQGFRVGSAGAGSIFAIPPHLATPPIVGSYGTIPDYGTIRSARGSMSRQSIDQVSVLWREPQDGVMPANVPDQEIPPILVKEVEQDGKIVLAVEGQSTLPQTVFNSIK